MIISIDLWGTLIKASPTFSLAKTNLMKNFFGSVDMGEFDKAKVEINKVIESSGWQPSIQMLFTYVCGRMTKDSFTEKEMERVIRTYQRLSLRHPPVLYDRFTKASLMQLSENHELVLSSNTLLMEGATLEKFLVDVGIRDCFTKLNFSDQLRAAKPSKIMYGGSSVHIGDNVVTDGTGAKNLGIKSIIINSNGKRLKDIVTRDGHPDIAYF